MSLIHRMMSVAHARSAMTFVATLGAAMAVATVASAQTKCVNPGQAANGAAACSTLANGATCTTGAAGVVLAIIQGGVCTATSCAGPLQRPSGGSCVNVPDGTACNTGDLKVSVSSSRSGVCVANACVSPYQTPSGSTCVNVPDGTSCSAAGGAGATVQSGACVAAKPAPPTQAVVVANLDSLLAAARAKAGAWTTYSNTLLSVDSACRAQVSTSFAKSTPTACTPPAAPN